VNGEEIHKCIGVNYLEKYSDEDLRLLLINTLMLANMNEYVQEELSVTCFKFLDKVAERVCGSLNEENIAKIKVFFGGLLCYTLNPQNIPGEVSRNPDQNYLPPRNKTKSRRNTVVVSVKEP